MVDIVIMRTWSFLADRFWGMNLLGLIFYWIQGAPIWWEDSQLTGKFFSVA